MINIVWLFTDAVYATFHAVSLFPMLLNDDVVKIEET